MMSEVDARSLLIRHGKKGDELVGKVAAICVRELLLSPQIQGTWDRFDYAVNWLCPQMNAEFTGGPILKQVARHMAANAIVFAEQTMTFDGDYKRNPDGAQ
jgi:hypothetical protein